MDGVIAVLGVIVASSGWSDSATDVKEVIHREIYL